MKFQVDCCNVCLMALKLVLEVTEAVMLFRHPIIIILLTICNYLFKYYFKYFVLCFLQYL
uniref:Uncharacterized protein n=1 Tax=Meloidogyne enterolobii TaxID=390850 RepID=A0A6V7VG61_MELEN|nr:unnamed protein product [Meloidogyne enterolobii]